MSLDFDKNCQIVKYEHNKDTPLDSLYKEYQLPETWKRLYSQLDNNDRIVYDDTVVFYDIATVYALSQQNKKYWYTDWIDLGFIDSDLTYCPIITWNKNYKNIYLRLDHINKRNTFSFLMNCLAGHETSIHNRINVLSCKKIEIYFLCYTKKRT